jgi:hypothetical protein
MSPLEIAAIVLMTGYAIYRQTVVSEVSSGAGRFKLAIIYGIVGIAVGGFVAPIGAAGWGLFLGSLVLSAVFGVIRGRKTQVWQGPDGTILRKGNALTITLFLGLIAAKFVLGTVAYLGQIQDGAGFSEIMVMIAIMVAVQAEIVYRRGTALAAASRQLATASR